MNKHLTTEQEKRTDRGDGVGRRSLVGGFAAGVLAAAGLKLADAKKGGNGRGRGKGKGKDKKKGKTKVFVCHRGEGAVELIRVGSPAVKGHTKHEDTVCGPAGTCQAGDPIACDQATGACTFAFAAAGTACTTESGQAGLCDAAGVCLI